MAAKNFEEDGEENQNFQSKVFCLTVPKNLVAEQPLCAVFQKNSGSGKENRGSVKSFPGKLFVSQFRKIS